MRISPITIDPTPRDARANLLLAALSAVDFATVVAHLEPVSLVVQTILCEPDAPLDHVWFPTTGCISLIKTTPDGAVEVATIGREGMLGVPVALGASSEPTRAIVQVQGEAYSMTASDFRELLDSHASIRRVMLRYSLILFNQVAQSVACNRLHALEARCARWLLITHDRVDGDEFRLTQEFLSYMLGVHRPAVSIAAGALQNAGFIQYSRGIITITNRAGLESASCCCYQMTLDDYQRLAS